MKLKGPKSYLILDFLNTKMLIYKVSIIYMFDYLSSFVG